ncbi:helix-turn-helix domain-containing protein [Nordella sp. HKS 07]|uniref:helix-turn-helix domain-containing protein n=1 Tax=Nordella sp. HKS 07 TaxID=2712222 RepID=UPI0013E1761A|nr:helix-turn-helix domain-containing protein [Nordella sp. HKS 07]QIG51035.1 helix-turn-helix domain-containing protein [Nordella sp. HKS 07]
MLTLAADSERDYRPPLQIASVSEPSKGLKTFDQLLSCQSLCSLDPHQHLYHQGDENHKIYRIESGIVRIYHVLSDGRRQIISLRFAGDIVGFEATSERHCSAEAITHVRYRCLEQNSAYRHMRDEPTLAPQLVSLLSKELEDARGQIAVLNRRSAMEKLSAFILELHRRQDNSPAINLELSRSDIADFLGLTIETVSRNLAKLKVKRIIRLPEVHKLIILDIERLEALAAGDCVE